MILYFCHGLVQIFLLISRFTMKTYQFSFTAFAIIIYYRFKVPLWLSIYWLENWKKCNENQIKMNKSYLVNRNCTHWREIFTNHLTTRSIIPKFYRSCWIFYKIEKHFLSELKLAIVDSSSPCLLYFSFSLFYVDRASKMAFSFRFELFFRLIFFLASLCIVQA